VAGCGSARRGIETAVQIVEQIRRNRASLLGGMKLQASGQKTSGGFKVGWKIEIHGGHSNRRQTRSIFNLSSCH
jgi:hypothetical protein